jgi:SNF2 family DNA or RNA helicase
MSYEMQTKPYEHQRRVFDQSKDREYYALFWEMGLGKTKTILDTAGHLWLEDKIEAALIIAPKGVYQNWYYDEAPIHMAVDYFHGMYRSAPRAKDKEVMEKLLKRRPELTICYMNVEAFSHKSGCEYAERFLRAHKCMIVVDESTAIKTPKATRTKTLLKLGKLAKYRRIMSGTPITQSPLDMYAQCEFLKTRALGFPTWTAFKSYYAVIVQMRMGTRSFGKITGFRNLDELEEQIKPFASRIKKTDCLDLPEKLYNIRYVEMTKAQETAYNSLKEMALLEFEQGMVTSTSALTTIIKLQQILCGHCKDDTGHVHDIENNRVSTALAIAEEVAGKIVFVCNFQRDVEMLVEALNEKYGTGSAVDYYGPTRQDDRQDNIMSFRNTTKCRFFVMSSAGSKGITLIEAKTMVYFSNGYNLETRLQSEDRIHRIGQNEAVNYIDLIVPDSIDMKIVDALRHKKNLADVVMDALRDECYN